MRKTGARGRRPLTKAQLLPLPADQVRRLSLKHHLALACLADRRGDVESLSVVANVVELARRLDKAAIELFRLADDALRTCIDRAERTTKIMVTEKEREAIAAVLVLHDAQLGRVAAQRYLDALEMAATRAQ